MKRAPGDPLPKLPNQGRFVGHRLHSGTTVRRARASERFWPPCEKAGSRRIGVDHSAPPQRMESGLIMHSNVEC